MILIILDIININDINLIKLFSTFLNKNIFVIYVCFAKILKLLLFFIISNNYMSEIIKNTNFGKTFADLKMDTSLDHIYKRSIENDISYFNDLKYGIDSINNYSNKGLYYLNPLIFAITHKNVNSVLHLLKNGSAPRGYSKFPGYPLYKTIEILHQDSTSISPELMD